MLPGVTRPNNSEMFGGADGTRAARSVARGAQPGWAVSAERPASMTRLIDQVVGTTIAESGTGKAPIANPLNDDPLFTAASKIRAVRQKAELAMISMAMASANKNGLTNTVVSAKYWDPFRCLLQRDAGGISVGRRGDANPSLALWAQTGSSARASCLGQLACPARSRSWASRKITSRHFLNVTPSIARARCAVVSFSRSSASSRCSLPICLASS